MTVKDIIVPKHEVLLCIHREVICVLYFTINKEKWCISVRSVLIEWLVIAEQHMIMSLNDDINNEH